MVKTVKFVFTKAVQVSVFETQKNSEGNLLFKPRPIYVNVHSYYQVLCTT